MKTLALKWLGWLPSILCASQLPASVSEPWELREGQVLSLRKLEGVDKKKLCPSWPVPEVPTSGPNPSAPGKAWSGPSEFVLLSSACRGCLRGCTPWHLGAALHVCTAPAFHGRLSIAQLMLPRLSRGYQAAPTKAPTWIALPCCTHRTFKVHLRPIPLPAALLPSGQ